MDYPVYLVHGQDGSTFAWLVDPPLAGCHARSMGREAVLAALPGQINEFLDVVARWRSGFDAAPYRPTGLRVVAELTLRGTALDGSMHLFPPELDPPTREEVAERLQILACTRQELLATVRHLPEEALDWQESGKPGTHTVRRQLQHVAEVERWYLERLWRGLPRLPRSRTVWERLERTRSLVAEWLIALPEPELARVDRYLGELWSVRKTLRRLVYHEWFHLQVVRRIAQAWGRAGGGQGEGSPP